MVQLEFTSQEQELLTSILETEIAELHMEIASTDRRDYARMLKDRRQNLRQILEKIKTVKEGTDKVGEKH